MLRVTLELLPFGDESRAVKLGEVLISNATPGQPRADYIVVARTTPAAHCGQTRIEGEVFGHDRESPVWMLVLKALFATIGRVTP